MDKGRQYDAVRRSHLRRSEIDLGLRGLGEILESSRSELHEPIESSIGSIRGFRMNAFIAIVLASPGRVSDAAEASALCASNAPKLPYLREVSVPPGPGRTALTGSRLGDARSPALYAVGRATLAPAAAVEAQHGSHRAPHPAQHEGVAGVAVAIERPRKQQGVLRNVASSAQIVPSLTSRLCGWGKRIAYAAALSQAPQAPFPRTEGALAPGSGAAGPREPPYSSPTVPGPDSSKALCSACTARSTRSRAITQEILIGDVEIMSMFTPSPASTAKTLAATPG